VPIDFFVDKSKQPLSSAPASIKAFLDKQDFHRLTMVKMEGSGKVISVTRTVSDTIRFNQVKYTKFTFSLVLGYAMTAHKA